MTGQLFNILVEICTPNKGGWVIKAYLGCSRDSQIWVNSYLLHCVASRLVHHQISDQLDVFCRFYEFFISLVDIGHFLVSVGQDKSGSK